MGEGHENGSSDQVQNGGERHQRHGSMLDGLREMGEGLREMGEEYLEHWKEHIPGPILDQETIEQLEEVAEGVATIEIPPPVTYPPSPPSSYMVPDFGDASDDEAGLGEPPSLMHPFLPTPAPPPQRDMDFPPGTLPTSFSFACGGWLQFYMFGVAKCLREHNVHKNAVFAGASAGALTALGLCVEGGSYDKAIEYCKKICVPQCRRTLTGPFMLHKYVRGCLDYSGGLDDWEHAKGKLHVAITRLPEFSSNRVSKFETKDELISALMASAAAFPLAPPVRYKGRWYIDGGIADFQPVLEPETITVNPFYFSQADIKPSRYVPAWWSLLPPSNCETVDWLYDLGFCDALSWMGRTNLEGYCKGRCRRNPDDPFSCKHRPERDPHPYDSSSRTFKRFLGYGNWPGIVDHATILLVATFWRTFAFLLIYAELFIKLVVVTARALMDETAAAKNGVALVLAMLLPSWFHTAVGVVLLLLANVVTRGFRGKWHLAGELARTICSLTLLLRAIPVVGPRIHLRKHHKLFRQSLVYRVAVHII